MSHPLRWFIPGMMYEVTTRTIQERYLLAPTAGTRELILGVLGRGLALYPNIRLHAFAYLSNHSHLLVSSSDGQSLAWFLGYVNSNVAREMGRLHDWRGPFWGRRGRPIPVLDESAAIDRLRYVMSQGVKEGLVASPLDWPGATAVAGLIGDMQLEGIWIDRDLETRARRSVNQIARSTYETAFSVPLDPIPPWSHLPRAEISRRHRTMLAEIEAASAVSLRRVLGAVRVAAQHPHDRPLEPAHRPAALCHASTRSTRDAFKAAYRSFVAAFRRASALLREALAFGAGGLGSLLQFPAGSYPRPAWHCTATREIAVTPASEHYPAPMPWPSIGQERHHNSGTGNAETLAENRTGDTMTPGGPMTPAEYRTGDTMTRDTMTRTGDTMTRDTMTRG